MMPRFTKFAYLLALYVIILASCAIQRPPVIQYRDSVRVEVRDRLIHDTVAVPVPVEAEKVVTRDTSSHLENSLASSDAVVSGGLLHHSLQTKPQTLHVPVAVPARDSIIYRDREVVKEVPVVVERQLTFWQRFRIGAFYWILAFALVGWRREILSILRKMI